MLIIALSVLPSSAATGYILFNHRIACTGSRFQAGTIKRGDLAANDARDDDVVVRGDLSLDSDTCADNRARHGVSVSAPRIANIVSSK